ncbi:MAG: acyltransferase [Gemmatimonadota bacterium]|jgi:1-acyl-sn-glycerol-3-phosphate acyltransferase
MKSLLSLLRGLLSLLFFSLNTVVWTLPLLVLHLLKLLIPRRGWRARFGRGQDAIGTAWIAFNNLTLRVLNPVRWDVEGTEGLSRAEWYLVVANHRSWVDILVLQKVFNRRIPFLKFFLKKELFWVPILGLAWWSLDYPFLERSTRGERDLETIRRAADRFSLLPVSIMNFVEGTRFTPEKWGAQRSPYRHLLKPKAGGLAAILQAMENRVHTLLDVTIVYPGGTPTFWGFLRGGVGEVRVRVKALPLAEIPLGDYRADKTYRRAFGIWLKEMWSRKDDEITALLDDPQKPGMS